jgi:hypothetical protein
VADVADSETEGWLAGSAQADMTGERSFMLLRA